MSHRQVRDFECLWSSCKVEIKLNKCTSKQVGLEFFLKVSQRSQDFKDTVSLRFQFGMRYTLIIEVLRDLMVIW